MIQILQVCLQTNLYQLLILYIINTLPEYRMRFDIKYEQPIYKYNIVELLMKSSFVIDASADGLEILKIKHKINVEVKMMVIVNQIL